MPDRDYYLKDDRTLAATRDAYKKHLAAMFTLAGMSDADKRAQGVFDLEVKMAQAEWANEDRRDEDKTYNPMSYSELKALAPQFSWDAYFKTAGIPLDRRGGRTPGHRGREIGASRSCRRFSPTRRSPSGAII
jgi:putative endopeptidase